MAIRSLSDPSGAGRCFAPQGMRIATPLRARNDDESRQLIPLIGLGTHRTRSAGWCSAQRIQNPMIAGGNHTLIPMTPPYREKQRKTQQQKIRPLGRIFHFFG